MVAVALITTAASMAAQQPLDAAELSDPTLQNFAVVESKPSESRIERPTKIKSLSKFVTGQFPDAFMIAETTVDGGFRAVTFRQTADGKVTDSILIERPDFFELHQDEVTLAPVGTEVFDADALKLFESASRAAAGNAYTNNCAGVQRTSGNPYPCCDPGAKAQNCTYYAWEMANRFWGVRLPKVGDAKSWGNLAQYGYPVAPTSGAGLYMIPVSSSGTWGHVAWSMELANQMVLVHEQNCGSTQTGYKATWHSISHFNKGFVQTNRNLPTPSIYQHSPFAPRKSNYDQTVTFSAVNVNAGARAVVLFPSGGRATLKDAQLRVENNGLVRATMRLNATGRWRIQIFNENGKFSSLYEFTVIN